MGLRGQEKEAQFLVEEEGALRAGTGRGLVHTPALPQIPRGQLLSPLWPSAHPSAKEFVLRINFPQRGSFMPLSQVLPSLKIACTFTYIFLLLSVRRFHSGEENGTPLQCSCLENPMDRGTC